MANSVVISRKNLIYGICLPLAVLVGYALAEPMDTASLFLIVTVLAIICAPLVMRWHHVVLIACCNAIILPLFVPGRPPMWELMTILSLMVSLLNRSLGRDLRFFQARSVSYSLLFLGLVVTATIMATGGLGFAALGSANYGSKKYLDMFLAIGLYFALSTPQIDQRRAGLYTAIFFLSGLTGAIGYIASLAGPGLNFLVELFPIEGALMETAAAGSVTGSSYIRVEGIASVGIALTCFLLSRYGARGALNLRHPWRILLLLVALVAILFSGFRSNVLLFLMLFGAVSYLEDLFTSRHFLTAVLIGILGVAVVLPNVRHLPLATQRALSFLPINVDPEVRMDAEGSTSWRLEMWKDLLPEVSRYLVVGKGFGLNPDDFYITYRASLTGGAGVAGYDASLMAGDFHNGPLSTLICFGIFGFIAFVWFLMASVRVLRLNLRYGDPSLHRINTFLLAYFVVKIFIFFVVFGSIYSDPAVFAGLVGLSVSLNGGVARSPELPVGEAPA